METTTDVYDEWRQRRAAELLKWYDTRKDKDADETIFEILASGDDLRDVEILMTALQERVNERQAKEKSDGSEQQD